MRILALAALMLVAAGPAAALDCRIELPHGTPRSSSAYRDAIECLIAEIARLERREARLAQRVEALEAEIAATPGDYLNEDGRASGPEGRPLASARFMLSARRTGSGTSLGLDRAVVAELCARPGGCRLSLALRLPEASRANPAAEAGVGPCLFLVNPGDGGWSLGPGCAQEGARQGADGDGGALGAPSGGEVIAAAGGACYFADADVLPRPSPETGLLARDHGPGLFLVAAWASADDPARQFRCELTLR